MLEFFGFVFLVSVIVFFMPLILTFLAVSFCLIMAGLYWIYETLSSPFKKS